MPVRIVPKLQLTEAQLLTVARRLAAPEHTNDNGACRGWYNENTATKFCVAMLDTNEKTIPIGILFADGPPEKAGAAWWLDRQYRGQGLGSEMIDAYAFHLKKQGVMGIGPIVIDTFAGEYHEQSSSLARRLRSHFS